MIKDFFSLILKKIIDSSVQNYLNFLFKMYKRRKSNYAQLTTKGDLRISNREYVGDVTTYTGYITGVNGSAAVAAPCPFAISQEGGSINPGNVKMFPWLSFIAQNFEKYRFRKLIFYLKSITSDAISSTGATAATLGQVMIAVDYNCATTQYIVPQSGGLSTAEIAAKPTTNGTNAQYAPFANANAMMNSEGAIMAKPSQHIRFPVEVNKKDAPYKWYYVRFSNANVTLQSTSGIGDLRLYNIGNLQIATSLIPVPITNASPGAFTPAVTTHQIWVEYDIEFETPIATETVNLSATYTGTGASAAANVFKSPTRDVTNGNADEDFLIGFDSANGVYFPGNLVGKFLVELHIRGTSAATDAITVALANASAENMTDPAGASVTTIQIPSATTPSANTVFRHVFSTSRASSTPVVLTYTFTGVVPTGTLLWSYKVKQLSNF
jgi:hypothetical protein